MTLHLSARPRAGRPPWGRRGTCLLALGVVVGLAAVAVGGVPAKASAGDASVAQVSDDEATTKATTYPSNIWGGGFVNVVAFSPDGTMVAAGGDVSGVHLSDSAQPGAVWRVNNTGLGTTAQSQGRDSHVASLVWDGDSTLYAETGNGLTLGGGQGRILKGSVSGGSVTWQLDAGFGSDDSHHFVVDGDNGKVAGTDYGVMARPTGHLMQISPSGTLWAMTQRDLLRRSADGAVWTQTRMSWDGRTGDLASGSTATGFSLDPTRPAQAWTSVGVKPHGDPFRDEHGLYLIRGLDGTPDSACRANPPPGVDAAASPQEVLALATGPDVTGAAATKVFVAYGEAGVWEFDPSPGSSCLGPPSRPVARGSWHDITPEGAVCGAGRGSGWTSLDGYRSTGSSGFTLWMSCIGRLSGSGVQDTMWRESVQTSAPRAVTTQVRIGAAPGTVDQTVAASNGSQWWHLRPLTLVSLPRRSNPGTGMGGTSYRPAEIAVDPRSADTVLVAGVAGVWRTDNGTAPQADAVWQPSIVGLGVTVEKRVAVDPDSSSHRVAVGDHDWGLIASHAGLLGDDPSAEPWDEDPTQVAAPSPPMAYATAFSANRPDDVTGLLGNRMYAGTDEGDATTIADVFGMDLAWSDLEQASGRRPDPNGACAVTGIAGGYDNGTGSLLAVDEEVAVAQDTKGLGSRHCPASGGNGVFYRSSTLAGWQPAAMTPAVRIGAGPSADPERTELVRGVVHGADGSLGTARGVVFLFDNDHGLFRSADGGRHFSRMLANGPGGYTSTYVFGGAVGYLAYDSTDDILYLSLHNQDPQAKQGLFALPGASTCAGPSACGRRVAPYLVGATSAPVPSPGPVAVDPTGHVWVAQLAAAAPPGDRTGTGTAPDLFRGPAFTSGAGAPVLTSAADATYRAVTQNPSAMAAGLGCGTHPQVCVYLPTRGNGTYVVVAPS